MNISDKERQLRKMTKLQLDVLYSICLSTAPLSTFDIAKASNLKPQQLGGMLSSLTRGKGAWVLPCGRGGDRKIRWSFNDKYADRNEVKDAIESFDFYD